MKILDVGTDETNSALLTEVEYADGRVVTLVTPMVTPEEQARIDAYLESL